MSASLVNEVFVVGIKDVGSKPINIDLVYYLLYTHPKNSDLIQSFSHPIKATILGTPHTNSTPTLSAPEAITTPWAAITSRSQAPSAHSISPNARARKHDMSYVYMSNFPAHLVVITPCLVCFSLDQDTAH